MRFRRPLSSMKPEQRFGDEVYGGSTRIILGIDPGLALLGYGLVRAEGSSLTHVAHGCIVTPAGLSVPARLRILFDELGKVRTVYGPTDVALESVYHTKNVSTAAVVGQARGVAMLAAVDGEVRFGEYTPTEVKHVVGGYGAATKAQIQQMVALILGLSAPPVPDDAADALAVAICHARHVDLAKVLDRARAGHS